MHRSNQPLLRLSLAGLAMAAGASAFAAPIVTVTPPNNARFLIDQRFDLRVEVKPSSATATPTDVKLFVDGAPVTFSSNDAGTGANAGWFGFNLRAYSNAAPGVHTLTAQATETGDNNLVTTTAMFTIIDPRGSRRPAKNVIILLGDGMGAAHRTAARIVRYGVTAGHPNGFLAMDQFPGSGMIVTASLNSIITDSAPGMGCYTTGNHSQNGQEGVYPAHLDSAFAYPRVEYLAEYMHRKFGKSTGIISTADIEDATPAANVVHTGNRNAGTGVCDQYLDEIANSGLTVLLGGGRNWFLPAKDANGLSTFGTRRSASTDYVLPADLAAGWGVPQGAIDPNRDLIGDFQNAGFAYTSSYSDLKALNLNNTTKLLGLFGYGNMNVSFDKIAKRRNPAVKNPVDDYYAPDQPMLDEMATAGLKVLSKNQNGFFLMIEGAHIDKQSHLMDADRAMWETLEFDNAVKVCRDFADQAGDTVVIVLADHECSGFSIVGALNGPKGISGSLANLQGLPSDVANIGPGVVPARQNVVGEYDAAGFPHYDIEYAPGINGFPKTADIDGKLLIGFGANADRYEGWLSKPLPVIDSLLPSDIKANLASGAVPSGQKYSTMAITRAESAFGYFVRGQVNGDQAIHTASDIPISAYSSGSRAYQQFYGVQENTDVFFKLARAAFGGY